MIFDAAEKYQSQIPAMQMLVALGFEPLSQGEALRLRGGRLRAVVLDDVLADQLLKINRYTYRGREYGFDLEDAHEAMRRLKPTPDRIKGLVATNQDVYDSLILGTTITKTIDGDSKSFSFRYIDWENPRNNRYQVATEVSIERTGKTQTKRCDIVGFVNGIPFLVIENKRPTETLKRAASQLIGYQSDDNIPHLFYFAQVRDGGHAGEVLAGLARCRRQGRYHFRLCESCLDRRGEERRLQRRFCRRPALL
jgi:type I restriction enzyme R subunit